MKIAIVGSRNIDTLDIGIYLPKETTEIVSGGAKGIDSLAKKYALEHYIPIREFLPDYKRYRRGAPIKRNLQIIEYADTVLAFWDGTSKGTEHVIESCLKLNKPIVVYIIDDKGNASLSNDFSPST
ncbi:MAG: DUF2493 domain-containing protein [Clostridia bacterium]|nr:DUF2493 domain-containing protein [Clostridia bacterium]